jgi:hypothetical protein
MRNSTRNIWTHSSNWKGTCSRINIIGRFSFWQDLAASAKNVELLRANLVLLRGKPDLLWKDAGLMFIRRFETMVFIFKPFARKPKRVIDTV